MPLEASLSQLFQSKFGTASTVAARAPGRVEFIGNHTDYNGGAVLGAAIDRSITVMAAPNALGKLRCFSVGGDQVVEVAATHAERLTGAASWVNYPLGVWRTLQDFGLPRPGGVDLLVSSDLPPGAGLSSSAALELATALVLLKLGGHPGVDPATLAKIGRHAENNYVGVPCGILDQGTIAHARSGQIVRIDCAGPVFSLVPFPAGVSLWVFNTREKHALVDGLYATRHRECMEAAKRLGVATLCSVSPAALAAQESVLTKEQAARARHVIGEHDRVRLVSEALEKGDLAAVGRALVDSHRSSQKNFENSTPTLDALVEALIKRPGVFGARLTGGGFGGAVMALTSVEFTRAAAEEIVKAHGAAHGTMPEALELHIGDGARLL